MRKPARAPKPATDTRARICYLDIETAPNVGFCWGKWEQDIIEFVEDWYILSFAVKWHGQKSVHVYGLDDYPTYKKNKKNDIELVRELWRVLDAADIAIAHNGDFFDLPKANTRFVTHGIPPPTPYRTIDTRKLARKYFRFDSNKLDELGRYLGIGRKLHHTGFPLWRGCMEGDTASWRLMKRYNEHDVLLLEQVYTRLMPWHTTHPTVCKGDKDACPKCGSVRVQRRGFSYTQSQRKRQRFQCLDCLGWYEGAASKTSQDTRESARQNLRMVRTR